MILRDAMKELVTEAQLLAETEGVSHHQVCQTLANKYELWNERRMFPTWLSRVVEGVIRDLDEGVQEV